MLRFTHGQRIRSIDQLDELGRSQLRLAGELWDGEELPASARLAEREDESEETSFLGFCERWRVVTDRPGSGEEHLYDAWLIMVDSGVFYRAGTTDVAAEIIQLGVECTDRALQDALEAAWKQRPGLD